MQNNPENKNLIVILGPTASGKTTLAVKLADVLNTEIISADSRQVFKGLDIGTGKDLQEYKLENKSIPYHLIDIVNPSEEFDLFCYLNRFYEVFKTLREKNIIPILAGGTTLYIHAILAKYKLIEVSPNIELRKKLKNYTLDELIEYLQKLKPLLHNTTDFENRELLFRAIEIAYFKQQNPNADYPGKEIILNPLIIGINWPREILKERILLRLKKRLKEGMIEEVENLHKNGCSWERLDFFGLEYKYISLYLQGNISYEEMEETLRKRICNFAKRQNTWYNKIQREGYKINWIEGPNFDEAVKLLKNEKLLR